MKLGQRTKDKKEMNKDRWQRDKGGKVPKKYFSARA